MKIFIPKVNESWVVDRFRNEWYKYNRNITTKRIKKSSHIWVIAPWLWKRLPVNQLKEKEVICSIHHIDYEKFDKKQEEDFYQLEQYVDKFHAISEKTFDQLSRLTNKSIYTVPFWVNQNIWFHKKQKDELRKKYGFSKSDYLIGSFQRDTEGSDLKSPKLIKGPDILLDIVSKLNLNEKKMKIILTGKRRQYLIENFEKLGIEYKYYEMVNFKTINDLYNILDLYLVTSRIEGGPQAIVECGLTKTPVLSTDVGIAQKILHPESIFNEDNFFEARTNVDYAYDKSIEMTIPFGMKEFINMFKI